MSTDLVAFLEARLRDDEAAARAAELRNGGTWETNEVLDGVRIEGSNPVGNPRAMGGDTSLWDDESALGMWPETGSHIARWDPARVLREVEAKRAIIALFRESTSVSQQRAIDAGTVPAGMGEALALLARPYSDHPDYRKEWAL